jgi:DNA-binding response OmpR family regulator
VARIVLIEDDDDLVELYIAALSLAGHMVWPTRDARAGLDICRQVDPNLVITDLHVPNYEALEAIAGSSGADQGPRVLVISGALHFPRAAALAQRLAGVDVLAKPFRPRELAQKVEEILGRVAPQRSAPDPR